MIDPARQAGLAGLVQGARDLLVESAGAAGSLPEVRPGAQIEARVLSLQTDGRAMLEAAGARFSVRVPEGLIFAAGQPLQLSVLETEPALRLRMVTPDTGPSRGTPSVNVSVSPAAERLAAFLGTAGGRTPVGGLLADQPVVPAPEARGEALVRPLRIALETSGLFYESHQAQWVAGQRELAALRVEPQARLASPPQRAEPSSPEPLMEPGAAAGAGSPAPAAPARAELLQALPPQVASLLEHQLDALAAQQIVWTGELWPGQRLEWRVEERIPGGEPGELASQPWRTRLKLTLPGLGAVEARLELSGGGLRVDVAAGGGNVPAGALRRAETDLRAALEARGLRLEGFRVEEGGAA